MTSVSPLSTIADTIEGLAVKLAAVDPAEDHCDIQRDDLRAAIYALAQAALLMTPRGKPDWAAKQRIRAALIGHGPLEKPTPDQILAIAETDLAGAYDLAMIADVMPDCGSVDSEAPLTVKIAQLDLTQAHLRAVKGSLEMWRETWAGGDALQEAIGYAVDDAGSVADRHDWNVANHRSKSLDEVKMKVDAVARHGRVEAVHIAESIRDDALCVLGSVEHEELELA